MIPWLVSTVGVVEAKTTSKAFVSKEEVSESLVTIRSDVIVLRTIQ